HRSHVPLVDRPLGAGPAQARRCFPAQCPAYPGSSDPPWSAGGFAEARSDQPVLFDDWLEWGVVGGQNSIAQGKGNVLKMCSQSICVGWGCVGGWLRNEFHVPDQGFILTP